MGYIGAGPTRFNTADELTVTGDAEFNGNLTVKGTTTTIDSVTVQNFDMGDNDKIRLGDSQDLIITHDGTDSIINEAGTGSLKFQYGGTDGVVFDSSGNVGVGTSNPNSGKLHVSHTTGTIGYFESTQAAANVSNVVLNSTQTNSSANATFQINHGTTAQGQLRLNGDSSFAIHNKAGLAESLRITSSGNVGIGQTNPAYLLTAEGDKDTWISRIYNTGSDANASALLVRSDATAAHDALVFGVYADSAYKLVVKSTGNVGIGTASPTNGKVEIQTAATTAGLWVQTGGTTSSYTIADFRTGTNAPALAVKGDGRVGIGTTSPDVLLDIEGASATQHINATSGNANTFYQLAGTTTGSIEVGGGNSVYLTANNASGNMYFRTGGANTRMTIDSSGSVLVGTTSATPNPGVVFQPLGNVTCGNSAGNSGFEFATFRRSATQIGSITQSGTTGVAYNTSSDYRLKENVTADWDATTRLKQLNPVRFNFITDADTTVDGFLAHEVQDIVPEAITGTKDGMRDEEYTVSAATGDIYTPATDDADEVIHSADVERPEVLAEGQQWRETTAAVMGTRSVPDYQGIDQSKLVPLLVKTIQELEARIAALETA